MNIMKNRAVKIVGIIVATALSVFACSCGNQSNVKVNSAQISEKIKYYKDQYNIDVPTKDIDFNKLVNNINKDIYAWLYIPEIGIDTPVVQHPTDDTYYSKYNIDGTQGYPGAVYTEAAYNKKDFKDIHTAIYGKSFKNGAGLSALLKLENKDTFDKTKYIFIYTPDDVLVYRIFCACERVSSHPIADYNFVGAEWIDYLDSLSKVEHEKEHSIGGYDFKSDSRIIDLVTTPRSDDRGTRFVTYGVLLK